jgi:hypothetical protein
MPDDVMDRLAQADPARTAGPSAVRDFDPDAPAGRALLDRAQVRASAPVHTGASHPRSRPPALAAAGALAAATLGAAALLVLGGGDPRGTPDARAAVVRAAQALPAADAGLIVRSNRTVSDAPGRQLLGDTRQELRYNAHAVEAGGIGTYRRERDGRLVTAPMDAVRIVDGKLYVDLDADGDWQERPGAPTTGAGSPEALAANARRGADRDAATALARALTDVRRTGGNDGTTTYAGTLTPAALTAAYEASDPFTVESLTAHADQLIGGVIGVQMAVGADGALDTITFTERTPWTHPTLVSATTTLTIDYRGLGVPQEITAP